MYTTHLFVYLDIFIKNSWLNIYLPQNALTFNVHRACDFRWGTVELIEHRTKVWPYTNRENIEYPCHSLYML